MLRKFLLILVFTSVSIVLPQEALRAAAPRGSRVRALLVCDTYCRNASGLGIAADRNQVRGLLQRACETNPELKGRVTIDVLDGPRVTPRHVLAYYAKLRVHPSETLLFYYSGHGGTDPYKGHFLAMSGGHLRRDQLRAAMRAKKPRLIVMLTDCCASIGNIGPARTRRPATRPVTTPVLPTARGSVPGKTLMDLLLRHTGITDISSSVTARPSLGGVRGSVFTCALCELLTSRPPRSLDADRDGFVSWPEFVDDLRLAALLRGSRPGEPHMLHRFSLARRG